MTKVSCSRKFEFDAGHRVFRHGGKCRFPHGHRYVLEVEAKARRLNDLGMVIDFADLKKVIGKFIDDEIDHGFMVFESDTEMVASLESVDAKIFRTPFNPTAENLAEFFLAKSNELMRPFSITVSKVTLFETPNCKSVAKL